MAPRQLHPTESSDITVPLRIVVKEPPAGVLFCVQGKPGEPALARRSSSDDLVFEIELRFGPPARGGAADAPWIAKGPFAQGPPAARFLYVGSGSYAGEPHSAWGRRAKVPLGSITRELVERGSGSSQRLTATIAGRARDGGPACACVPLLGAGWRWTK